MKLFQKILIAPAALALGVLAPILGIIASCFIGLWGIIYYPIKRAFKNRQKNKTLTQNKKKNNKRK